VRIQIAAIAAMANMPRKVSRTVGLAPPLNANTATTGIEP
jgi:hypothetical protein